jgi:hypothetical protein
MDKAKIRLSEEEAELVANANWILTKNAILQKVNHLLGQLQSGQQEYLQSYLHLLPAEVTQVSAKISKGENYKGLPYLVLDYPRYFEKENQFAIRTMFWWGNFFSTTLLLSGIYKEMYTDAVTRSFTLLKEDDFFICIGADQWEHHFEAGNYTSLKECNADSFVDHINNKDFLKLAKRFPLARWDDAGDLLIASFSSMIKCLAG